MSASTPPRRKTSRLLSSASSAGGEADNGDEEDLWFPSEYDEEEEELPPGVEVVTIYAADGLSGSVMIPTEWVGKLDLGSNAEVMLWGQEGTVERFRASLSGDPNFQVEIFARKSSDPAVHRELFMSRRLCQMRRLPGMGSLSGAAPVLDVVEAGDWTFLLRGLAGGDLAHRLEHKPEPTQEAKLKFAILTLIECLRGLRTLGKLGISLGTLTWEAVAFREDRAYIFDLSRACLLHDGESGLSCDTMAEAPGSTVCSAFYQAPEMTGGIPTGPENGVWGAGLFFSEMCLGYLPTTSGIGPDFLELDSTEAGRDTIRTWIRRDFHIKKADGFADLPASVRALLAGMLEKDPARRWSVDETLELAIATASEMGIQVPDEQEQLQLSDCWRTDT